MKNKLNETEVQEICYSIAKFGKLLYNRHLTDTAGGNISIRFEDTVFITPRYAGSKYFWNLEQEQICRVHPDTGSLLFASKFQPSREIAVHLALYALTSQLQCSIIHAHPKYLTTAALLELPLLPVLENVMKFGQIPVIPFSPACSEALAQSVSASIKPSITLLEKHPLLALTPHHGVFAIGQTIESTFDCIERLEQNAFCLVNLALAGKDVTSVHQTLLDAMNR